MCSLGFLQEVQLIPFLFDFKLNRTTVPQVERSVVLVISPLVSLMVDQVSGLFRHVSDVFNFIHKHEADRI